MIILQHLQLLTLLMFLLLLHEAQLTPLHQTFAHHSLQPCLSGFDLRLKPAEILSEIAFLIILDILPLGHLSPFFIDQLVHGVL